MSKNECKKVFVPKDACYLRFTDEGEEFTEEYEHSANLGTTIRGEQVIVDFDVKGRIQGIELLGSREAPKRCESWSDEE